MKDASFLNRARRSLARFRRADGGNVAVMFGLAILPVIASVGAAVDYSRVNNARTAMQAALDTAALMISKDATGLSASEINQKAQTYFNSLYNHPEAEGVVVNATYTNSASQGSKVVLTGSATMQTDFMRVVGYPTLDFGASSTTVWGTTKLRVALALDNTGSMSSSGKMSALKTAAEKLFSTNCNPPQRPMATSMYRSCPSPRTSTLAVPAKVRSGCDGILGNAPRRRAGGRPPWAS